jgi:diaminohydroxyphosphoribosylaminopyrimidine deaminase / 5-amino-6-(5-phosphoribosylamino)uracil reductase
MVLSADAGHMRRALELAALALGQTSPNPMVGALLVKNGKVIAEGYHHRAGEAHAEIVTLKKAGAKAKGGTLYVTLEPCCHTGRTGPCVEAIIKAGIKRVVFGAIDPDPRINGKGARILRKAGISVTGGVLAEEAARLNLPFHFFHQTGRPFVTLKLAQSLDGRIATSTGDSKWITGKDARTFAHHLRAEADAIVVGTGTVRKDNPSLTVRLVEGKNPYRIILSRSLDFPSSSTLVRKNRDFRTIIVSTQKSAERYSRTKHGKQLIYWSIRTDRSGKLRLDDFLEKCRAFGLRSILVEGGAELATSFLAAGLVDRMVMITAPVLIGNGLNSVGELGIKRMAQTMKFADVEFVRLGEDCAFIGFPVKSKKRKR